MQDESDDFLRGFISQKDTKKKASIIPLLEEESDGDDQPININSASSKAEAKAEAKAETKSSKTKEKSLEDKTNEMTNTNLFIDHL